MKFFDLNTHYVITEIKEHKKNKMKLLGLMNSLPNSQINTDLDTICKTDWNLSKDIKKDYVNVFLTMIKPYMVEMAEKMKFKDFDINNVWFQMYNKNNNHNWHIHNYANWTNVYYLHLPNEQLVTEIYDLNNNKIVDNIKIKEGEMITFPANMLHRSPVNSTDEFKVVIAYNSNFFNTTLKEIKI